MTDTEALVLLILWLSAVITLAIGCALLILRIALENRPAGQLKVREVLVPLWCALAGPRYQARLRAIMARRLSERDPGSTTVRDAARHRARKPPHEPRHKRPRQDGWLSELDDNFLLDRGSPYSWMMYRRWPPYL
jgi:hypothetical protein